MAKIVTVHSFRGGTGKSNLSANLTTALALQGLRVAVFDTDLASPGIHVLFGFSPGADELLLNDYLQAGAQIRQCAHEVTPPSVKAARGHIWLVPAAMSGDRIAKLLREGYEVERLNDAFFDLADQLKLDVIVVDTHPGINEETLLTAAISDCLLMAMRPDAQDYLGTAVAIEVAQRLDVPSVQLVVNMLPDHFDHDQVLQRVKDSYGVQVGCLLPLSEELHDLASSGVALLSFPDHRWSDGVRRLAASISADIGL
jgi:MinD-like ATPase involved in chromosome partitioning or flagellar assembly